MPDRRSLFIGRAGELAVLSEFLSRGYNAATPEIDTGEDVFVIEDGKDGYWPVQVKTATATRTSDGSLSAQFTFRRDQLVTTPAVELTYVLALRAQGAWESFLVIPRVTLFEMYRGGLIGTQISDMLTWSIRYTKTQRKCQQADFTSFERNWDPLWPNILDRALQ